MRTLRVLYIAKQFPQLSETYVRSEIEAIADDCEVLVLAEAEADLPYKNRTPYRVLSGMEAMLAAIEEFSPDVLHSHWLYNIWTIAKLASKSGIPYTIRAHSFDVLLPPEKHLPGAASLINDDLCLGVLTFPFGRAPLEKIGVRSAKLHDCYPVVNFKRFYDPSPNGDAIMNVGACLPKKKMEAFVELAARVPDKQLNLYALGYNVDRIIQRNEASGGRVNVVPPLDPEDMPREYKKHRWLVYTASREVGTVGWPMAVAEAQASGVGVCMANLRPDLREYVGEAGFVFDSTSEVIDIMSRPFPDELRQKGFEQAKKSDVFEHKRILTDLWDQVRGRSVSASGTASYL